MACLCIRVEKSSWFVNNRWISNTNLHWQIYKHKNLCKIKFVRKIPFSTVNNYLKYTACNIKFHQFFFYNIMIKNTMYVNWWWSNKDFTSYIRFLICSFDWGLGVMVFNTTFNNISVISWRSVLVVEEIAVLRENHRPSTSHWQTLSHDVVLWTLRLSGIRTYNISGEMHWLHKEF